MGSTKDVMELFAERDLRRLFSDYDGWKVAPVNGAPPASGLYRASRNKMYYNEVAFIVISFDPVPRENCISALDALPVSHEFRTKKYLLTPQAIDTSGIPPHVRVIEMNSFAFVQGELVWLTKKQNAKRFVQESAVTA